MDSPVVGRRSPDPGSDPGPAGQVDHRPSPEGIVAGGRLRNGCEHLAGVVGAHGL